MESKEKKSEKPEIREMLQHWATTTTAHGVSRIAAASRPPEKLYWIAIWCTVMVFFVFLSVKLILLYQRKPVSTKVELWYERNMLFPGVTICSLNMLKKKRIKEFTKGSFETLFGNYSGPSQEMYKERFKERLNNNSFANFLKQNIQVASHAAKRDDMLFRINNKQYSDRLRLGYAFSEFIKSCTWNGIMCDKGGFEDIYWNSTWNWAYGNCFNFNSRSKVNGSTIDLLKTDTSGTDGGLVLTIDTDIGEYVKALAVEEGIRVLVADQDVGLFPYEEGFSVPPGVIASIGISKVLIKREDPFGNGSCRADDTGQGGELKYSVQNCVVSCKGKAQMEACNCTEPKYSMGIKNVCRNSSYRLCLDEVDKKNRNGELNCVTQCPQPCHEIMYRKKVIYGNIYPEGFLYSFGTAMPKGIPLNKLDSYVRSNIIQLKIFFEDQNVEQISTRTYYQFDNLISDIGGQLGLWIGVSAVTCVEFLALIYSLCCRLTLKRKAAKNSVDADKDAL